MRWPENLKLSGKLMLPVILGAIGILGISMALMLFIQGRNTRRAGLRTAESVSHQITTLRTFYTAEVVPRAQKAGLRISHDFARREDTLPLPATFTRVIGEEIAAVHPGMNIRLYSDFPFPHRTASDTKLDDFEREALEKLRKEPQTAVAQLENVQGRLSMRYAIADLMCPACVNCHNTHPESPKTDWKIGDVRGVVEVTVPVDEAEAGTILLGMVIIAGMIIVIGIIVVLFGRTVLKPIKVLQDAAQKVGNGDLTVEIAVGAEDEIGDLAEAFRTMTQGLRSHLAPCKRR